MKTDRLRKKSPATFFENLNKLSKKFIIYFYKIIIMKHFSLEFSVYKQTNKGFPVFHLRFIKKSML